MSCLYFIAAINVEQHPNREVDLDEVEEGEMVEDKLIIPEEFKNYLNQVADNECASNTNTNTNIITNNANQIANGNGNENKVSEQQQIQILPTRRTNVNPENFNQWRNPQAYQMASPLNQPQSPPLVVTPHTPVTLATDMWPCTQYQQAPPPYPNNYHHQNGHYPSNATQMQCNYNNGYSSAINYGIINYGSYLLFT